MIRLFDINRSKKTPSVVLVHGLFTGGGFWLQHLSYFRDRRLNILDIDYDSFLTNFPDSLHQLEQIADRLPSQTDLVIGHSFGCSISSLLGIKADMTIHICDVRLAEKSKMKDYVHYLSSNFDINPEKAKKTILMAEDVYKVTRKIGTHGPFLQLVPTSDEFFDYNVEGDSFKGDHFQIDDALSRIKRKYL